MVMMGWGRRFLSHVPKFVSYFSSIANYCSTIAVQPARFLDGSDLAQGKDPTVLMVKLFFSMTLIMGLMGPQALAQPLAPSAKPAIAKTSAPDSKRSTVPSLKGSTVNSTVQGLKGSTASKNSTVASAKSSTASSAQGSILPTPVSRSNYALPEAYELSKSQAKSSGKALPSTTVSQPQIVAMNDVPTPAISSAKTEVEAAPKNLELKLGMIIEGYSRRDENAERQDAVYTALTPKLKWNLAEWAFVDLQPKIKFRTGHIQGATPTNGRESALTLSRAEFTFSDANFFRLSAGALDTTDFHSNLLLDMALPGALAMLSSGQKNIFAVGIFGIGGVPGSSTKTDVSDEVDKTPSYMSTGVFSKLQTETVLSTLVLSTYQFRNLPTSIGNDSVKLGNSGLGSNLTPVQTLQYQFRGIEVNGKLNWKLTPKLEWKNDFAGVRNVEAPSELNTGWGLTTKAEIGVSADWLLIPEFTYFNVQPDAVVANFNDERITTNRVGYLGGVFVQYKKKFKVGGYAGERTLVFENPTQGRETVVGINVEALDVSF